MSLSSSYVGYKGVGFKIFIMPVDIEDLLLFDYNWTHHTCLLQQGTRHKKCLIVVLFHPPLKRTSLYRVQITELA